MNPIFGAALEVQELAPLLELKGSRSAAARLRKVLESARH